MIDVLFRILNVIKNFIPVKDVKQLIGTYVPDSALGVINHYTKGVINMTLTWVYVAIMAVFLYYIVKIFIKRKKI